MTVKELQKLKRQELLQLLIEQGREAVQLQEEQKEKEEELLALEESNIRLKGKIDEKNAQIERLKGRLEGKKIRIEELEAKIEEWHSGKEAEAEKPGTVAEAAQKLNIIIEAAHEAADQYLYIRNRAEMRRDGGQMRRPDGIVVGEAEK